MAHHQPFQIIGFHSCDRKLGLDILHGKDKLKPSTNKWDWLGEGIYFWEQNPEKALEYAIKCAIGKQWFAGKIETPFVLKAVIELGKCLNLVEPQSLKIVAESHTELEKTMAAGVQTMPKNKGDNRALDCAVIQAIHESNKKEDKPGYDTVRCPFHEDGKLYPESNFTKGLHIEVCVRNPELIRGYYLPTPISAFNPFLTEEFDKEKYLELYNKKASEKGGMSS